MHLISTDRIRGGVQTTTAIVCPRNPINAALLTELEKVTGGRVLKIIGSDRKADLTRYDRVIVVYQYSVSSINKDFARFLEGGGCPKDAALVVDIPAFYIDSGVDWAGGAKGLIAFFSSWRGEAEARVAVMDSGGVSETLLGKYAERMGAEYLGALNRSNLSRCDAAVVFDTKIGFHENMSARRANLHMASGAFLFAVGALSVYAIANRDMYPIMAALFGPALGSLLFYVGYRTRKFLRWNGGNDDAEAVIGPPHTWTYPYVEPVAKRVYLASFPLMVLPTAASGAVAVLYFAEEGGGLGAGPVFMLALAGISTVMALLTVLTAGRIQGLSGAG
ncbi:MAG: hypothetical protein FWH47_06100, partial [Methanomassiliicoccaceae archaeon]|nr:hypothetical protein [Methanomassiliicoccaceae archaeon]